MKKFINRPENLVRELLEGYAEAYPRHVRLAGSSLVARAAEKAAGKVGLVTLGGSGHEPGLSGFVGEGLLDVSVPGEIFAAPAAPRCLEGIQLADRGAGVLLVILNHAGDVLSGNIALQKAQGSGMQVRFVLTHEDISTGPKNNREEGRGLVGFLPVYKVAGAAAEAGQSLDEVWAAAEKMNRSMATLAVACREATHPSTGQMIGNPESALGDNEMEIGMGQHGESGTGRMQMQSADHTAELMIEQLLHHQEIQPGEKLLVIISGSGATTLMELFIVFRRVKEVLKSKSIEVVRSLVGEFITTQEQAGFQLLIARMDDELIRLWDAPCCSPYLTLP